MTINDTIVNVELLDLLTELSTQLHLNGINLLQTINNTPDNVMVSCPYHKDGQERRPSAGIKKDDGTFHCFACGEVHTLPEVISFCFGKTDDVIGAFGWNWILKNFVTISVEERKDIELDMGRADNSVRNMGSKDYVSEEELDSYREYHPYMWKRKLTPEVVELFDIGYDKKTHCITFPVRDVDGNCLFIARRSVNTKFFNYPSGAEKPLYGLYEYTRTMNQIQKEVGMLRAPARLLDKGNEIVICESMLDALYFWTIGEFAVALNGLGNELQYEQLRRLPCRKLIVCTDNDEAGLHAFQRIRHNIRNKLVTRYKLPDNRKDANECTIEELENLQEIF